MNEFKEDLISDYCDLKSDVANRLTLEKAPKYIKRSNELFFAAAQHKIKICSFTSNTVLESMILRQIGDFYINNDRFYDAAVIYDSLSCYERMVFRLLMNEIEANPSNDRDCKRKAMLLLFKKIMTMSREDLFLHARWINTISDVKPKYRMQIKFY